jgi:hypothetical protein
MALPSLDFLRESEARWKARHAWRQARLELWRRRESYRYRKWRGYRETKPEGDPLRSKWWGLYEGADQKVDKWLGLRDEASYWLHHRREQIKQRESDWASEHFRIAEFDTRDGTPVPEMAYGGVRDLCERVLEPMRRRFGAAYVTSGYRHEAYNAGIGGATRSYHIYELRDGREVAADVTFASGNPAEWASYARQLAVGGVGQYNRSGFVHVDSGPRRDWWG